MAVAVSWQHCISLSRGRVGHDKQSNVTVHTSLLAMPPPPPSPPNPNERAKGVAVFAPSRPRRTKTVQLTKAEEDRIRKTY